MSIMSSPQTRSIQAPIKSIIPWLMAVPLAFISNAVAPMDAADTALPDDQSPSSVMDAEACPETEPTIATPPRHQPGSGGYYDPLPRGPYFVSEDRKIWAWNWGQTYLPGTHKYFWLKPQEPLEVSGKRLDGEAPPLEFSSASARDQASYASSYLIFSSIGCWQVDARSADSSLRFVIYIDDLSPIGPPQAPSQDE